MTNYDEIVNKIKVTPLNDTPDWTFDLLGQYQQEIAPSPIFIVLILTPIKLR
jgi:hypothetical protein